MSTTGPQHLEPECGERHPDKDWLRCNDRPGHQGDHAAESPGGEVYATWPQDTGHGGECLTCHGHVTAGGVFIPAATA